MQKLIFESVVIGLITSILGSIILKIIVRFNTFENNDSLEDFLKKYKNTYIIYIALFFTGILIHLLLEYIGLNKWYCEKKCAGEGINKKCKIVCEKEI